MNDRDDGQRNAISGLRRAALTSACALMLFGCSGTPVAGPDLASAGQPSRTSTTATSVIGATGGQSAGMNTAVSPKEVGGRSQLASGPSVAPVSPSTEQFSADAEVVLGDEVTVSGSGATIVGNTVHITSGGTYLILGSMADGQIVVDTEDDEAVKLVLNGASITSSTTAPIFVERAKATAIVLADGSTNYVADGDAYADVDAESEGPDAAIFSKGDLVISGDGSLTVDANFNDAIASKDDLEIRGGTIAIESVFDGIRGRDKLVISGGSTTISAAGDGLKSTNDEDPEKGFVLIQGGSLNVAAGEDGIQAETRVTISEGSITLTTGGGSANGLATRVVGGSPWSSQSTGSSSGGSAVDATSTKGIKAAVDVTIAGGSLSIESADDAIHSNDSMTISGGKTVLASGDDGIHADSNLEIKGGEVQITKSFEGIESANITINDGVIHLVASDDGLNVAGGADGSSINGRPGQASFSSSGSRFLKVYGGYTVIEAAGDGVDVNGAIAMSGGTIIVQGPTANNNGAIDYDQGFKITGGTLVAVGSAGMAQAADMSSTQPSVLVNLPASQAAGTVVRVESQSGEGVLTFVPAKAFQSVVVSSPELKIGSSYAVFTGGKSTGTSVDGVYTGGAYTAGSQAASFTISGMVTTSGAPRVGAPGGVRR